METKKNIGFKNEDALEIAQIGKGYFDFNTGNLHLDDVARIIHETDKPKLSLLSLLKIYRKTNTKSFVKGIKTGLQELQIKFESNVEIAFSKTHTKWIHIIGIPNYINNTPVSIQFLFKDIDKEARERIDLSIKSSLLENSFANSPEGLGLIGINGGFMKVNPALCNMLGYTEKELINKKVIDFVMPHDLEELESVLVEFLTGKITKYTGEKQYVNRYGKTIHISLTISIIKNTREVPTGFMFQLVDITQIHQSTARIEQLLHLVSDQNKRLVDFAYIVSHNLRSHTGNLEMLLNLVKQDFPEHVKNNYHPMMQSSVVQLQSTIKDLNDAILSYSYSEEALKPITVSNIINQAIENNKLRIHTISAKINNLIPKTLVIQHIEEYLLNIFCNLLDNSIKYRMDEEALKIDINYTEMCEYHLISFKDNGSGFDMETNYHKVFGMYKTFHDRDDSRGVGLFIIKNQIEALKGKVDVVSELNGGTTFKLYFKK